MTDTDTTEYLVKFTRGPLDGGEETIVCGYPPKELHGYQRLYSRLGQFYVYLWPKPPKAVNH